MFLEAPLGRDTLTDRQPKLYSIDTSIRSRGMQGHRPTPAELVPAAAWLIKALGKLLLEYKGTCEIGIRRAGGL